MATLIEQPTRILFFTGKGGVGKTSSACATAIGLADAGRRVLLVSTDPASNLDEVLRLTLSSTPKAVPGVDRLSALNIDPEQAARAYRERVVGPYRGVLPASAVASIEEQLSVACTVEIAAFDEFSKLLGNPATTAAFVLVTLPEATPIHEAMQLERDLARAQITPFAWVVNQSLTPLDITDPVLRTRRSHEAVHLRELAQHTRRAALEPWHDDVRALGPVAA